MSTYQEFLAYSPFYDAVMARISMTDERGSEYFVLIPAKSGKAYRTVKAEALEMIIEAMAPREDGTSLPPGEVQRT